MNFVKVAGRDIKSIIKNPFIRVSVIAIIIVPMLYSLLYLAAFWDPYGKLENLPVAIVNLDKGWTDNGKKENYGNQFVDKFKDNKQLKWEFVGADEAYKGVKGTKYYAEFIIPKDFTQRLIKAKTSKPVSPVVLFRCNEKKNFLAGQITGKSVLSEIKILITKNLVDESTKLTFDNLYKIKDSLKTAADGSKKISDAVAKANDMVKDVKAKYDQNQDLIGLINQNNFNMLKTTIGDAKSLKDVDTSMLKKVPQILTPTNISTLKSINNDLKGVNVEKIVNDPTIQELPKLASEENLKNVNALLKDTDVLEKVDVSKMQPLLKLMQNEDKIMKVLNDAKTLYSKLDQSKLQPLLNLMKNKTQLMQLLNSADKLSTQTDTSKLLPLINLMQNSDKLFKLMDDADKLSSITSATELQPVFNLAKNKDKLTPLMLDALKLSSIDINSMQTLLDNQVKAANSFVEATSFLTKDKDSLKTAVMTNATLTAEQKKELVTVLEASSAARTNMADSANQISGMTGSLASLKTAQSDIKNVMPLVVSLPQSIQYVETKVIPQITSLQSELADAKQLIGSAQGSITYVKGLTPQLIGIYGQLQAAKPLMKGVPDSLNYVDGMLPKVLDIYNSAVSLKPLANGVTDSLGYVKKLVPELLVMKSDLDKNQNNLKTVEKLLSKVNNSDTKEILAKVSVLEKDIEKAKPMINAMQSELTDANIDKLKDVPALTDKLVTMQNELKDNQKILEVVENALTDDNYNQAKKLIDAVPTLVGQVQQLADGTKKLSDGLNDGYKDIKGQLVNSSATMGKFMSEPVKVDDKAINPSVPNYGTGFAPYFIPLSLWVGAIMMFFVISLSVDKDIKAGTIGIVAGKYLSFGYIGIAQAVLVSLSVLALGLKPTNIPVYILFVVFLSFVFIAIIQSLVFLLGMDVGRLLSIVLLILQLTSCGGTFPLEIIPPFFRKLNPFMPFTYAVNGLREIISAKPIDYSIVISNSLVLAGLLFGFLAISMLMKNHADKVQERIEAKKAEAAKSI